MTRPFHVNLGLRFAKPYESDYAVLRRCLTANPGISLAAIEAALRKPRPERRKTLAEKLKVAIDRPDLHLALVVEKSYRRQCPECAGRLYHTDAYALPWLLRCPIHHCPLTERCPVCARPWPDPRDMAATACPGCGRTPMSQWKDSIRTDGYEVISDIYRFAAHEQEHYFFGGRPRDTLNETVDPWWRKIPTNSSVYATYQAHCQSTFADSKLDALHIARPPLHHRSTRLFTVDGAQLCSPPLRGDPLSLDLDRAARAGLRQDFAAMRAVVDWFACRLPEHPIHIANYRHLRLSHFVEGPIPCPYCLALSLWFFHTAARRYGRYYVQHIDEYPFWAAPVRAWFVDAWEPYIRTDDGVFCVMEAAFNRWFHRRGLELLFVHLLHTTFEWFRRLVEYRRSRDIGSLYGIDPRPALSDQLYGAHLAGETFTFYYEHEHPLNDFVPPPVTGARPRCAAYHKYLLGRRGSPMPFDYRFHPSHFTYQTFLDVHASFRALLRKSFEQG